MKAERFLREYANAKIRWAEANELMRDEYKVAIVATCKRAVKGREQGIISLEEAIKMILEAGAGSNV